MERLLKKHTNKAVLGNGPADQVVKLILESDEIQFVIGTRINIAHQDPNMGMDVEIRRTVIKRIALTLEEKFLKKVKIIYI